MLFVKEGGGNKNELPVATMYRAKLELELHIHNIVHIQSCNLLSSLYIYCGLILLLDVCTHTVWQVWLSGWRCSASLL